MRTNHCIDDTQDMPPVLDGDCVEHHGPTTLLHDLETGEEAWSLPGDLIVEEGWA